MKSLIENFFSPCFGNPVFHAFLLLIFQKLEKTKEKNLCCFFFQVQLLATILTKSVK
jgi:hypothetical protein